MAKKSSDYQEKYIEEKFEHLNEKIEDNYKSFEKIMERQDQVLAQILEQVKKTNWRVNRLEEHTEKMAENINTLQDETSNIRRLAKNPKWLIAGLMFISSIYISDIRQPFFEMLKKMIGLG